MSSTRLDRPVPATAGLSRVTRLRHSSPGRLQLLLAVLLTLGALTALVAGLTVNAARSGTSDLGTRAQPLLVEAETIYSALADADSTAAQAFLAGGLEPPDLTRRYQADLDRAGAALVSAARRTRQADAVADLNTGVSRYAALVAAARANNRQNLPVGAAYLSEASALNRETLQPQAQALFKAAQADVDDGYAAARSSWWVTLLVVLVVVLLATLLAAQRYLSRTTRRTFNLPLLAATAVTLVLALSAGAALVAQRAHLRAAETDGSGPVALLAEARILALRERGDEALTLANRGGRGRYEEDFDVVAERLGGPNGLLAAAAGAVDGEAYAQVRAAADRHTAYVEVHRRVRDLDDSGRYDDAVELALSAPTAATFADLIGHIDRALQDRRSAFATAIGGAGRGLTLLTVLGPLLALVVGGLAVAGIRMRLEEYR